MKNRFLLVIAEVNILESDISGQTGITILLRCFLILPCPDLGALLALNELAILFLRVDEGHISLILLRCLINQVEDTLCTCHTHDNRINLV